MITLEGPDPTVCKPGIVVSPEPPEGFSRGLTEGYRRGESGFHPLRQVYCDCGWAGLSRDVNYTGHDPETYRFFCPACLGPSDKFLWWGFMEGESFDLHVTPLKMLWLRFKRLLRGVSGSE